MPTTTHFKNETYQVTVTGSEPWFVPEMMRPGMTFVTMGPASIMKVKHLVLIVNGEQKLRWSNKCSKDLSQKRILLLFFNSTQI